MSQEVNIPDFIVAIGASAGGLDALERFFASAADDSRMAYVVLQHLSSEFKSLMDELLARQTSLPIHQAEDGMVVEATNVYLLPAGKEMIISEGRLLLAERDRNRELVLPIDHFFRSLAHDATTRAIGIVLSGTGSDGSRGVVKIHESGGLVMVQDEQSAKFDGMPRNAIDTGVVDIILPPDEMPATLARITKLRESGQVSMSASDVLPINENSTNAIFRMLRNRHGIDFASYRPSTITRRIERRLIMSRVSDMDEYVLHLEQEPAELNMLYKDLLIGVTRFFRDAQAYDRIAETVVPELLEKLDPDEDLRVWVAGCATGEEAYSMAILLHEAVEKLDRPVKLKIFASDAHRESLDFASRGIYQEESLADMSVERLDRFFQKKLDGYHVVPHLRSSVVFAPHNVITDAPFTSMSLVTCRNMLIYFRSAVQRRVISMFHFGLRVGGVLWLGPSETAGELADEFEPIDEHWRIFRKTRLTRIMDTSRISSAPESEKKAQATLPPRNRPGATDMMRVYDLLLEEHMSPGFLVSSSRELVHTFCGASKYLTMGDGRPSKDFIDLLHPDLKMSVSAAWQNSQAGKTHVVYEGASCDLNGENLELKITVRPLELRDDSRSETLVLIENAEAQQPIEAEPNAVVISSFSRDDYETIQNELRRTKDTLNSTIQDFEATNEELQATNEELVASNEELQSTNEELHSVNEELYTVNAEYQRKINELTELTDDMENLLTNTNVDTIFLDKELNIRKFTPGMAKTFNLIPQDIGRRIDTFTHNVQGVDVIRHVNSVLESSSSFEAEVRDKHGAWYLLRILPYLSKKEIDGVVLTMVEISTIKAQEARLTELSEIVNQSEDAIFRLDIEGCIRTWNVGAAKMFGLDSEQAIGSHLCSLVPQEERENIESIVARIVEGDSIALPGAKWLTLDGKPVDVSVTLSPIADTQGQRVGASTVCRDITVQKIAERETREAVRRRDNFLAMLSHELRNPLAAILNATSLLAEEELEDEVRSEAQDVIQRHVRHVARMLDDLLDVSRITHERVSLQRSVCDITKLTIDVLECVQLLAEEKQLQLHLENSDEPLFVNCDIGRLQQAQVNLLVNACKYTPNGGRIDYSLMREGNEAVVRVTDNGEGMDKQLMESVFELFVQGDQSLERSRGGMGLGLSLVRSIVNAHEGTVDAISQGAGMGSTFTIRLPLVHHKEVDTLQNGVADIRESKVLLVEDNPGILRMLCRSLELKGYVVETAESGTRALEQFENFRADIAVIDIGLPDFSGFEVARRLRTLEHGADVFLVAVTGYGQENDRNKATDSGFDLHLVKPIDPTDMMNAIASEMFSRNGDGDSEKQFTSADTKNVH